MALVARSIFVMLLIAIQMIAVPVPGQTEGERACTQEAKLCPDGSYVTRTGPDCQFAPCPDAKKKSIPAEGNPSRTRTVEPHQAAPERIAPTPKD